MIYHNLNHILSLKGGFSEDRHILDLHLSSNNDYFLFIVQIYLRVDSFYQLFGCQLEMISFFSLQKHAAYFSFSAIDSQVNGASLGV